MKSSESYETETVFGALMCFDGSDNPTPS
jgi:hypothetical protein